MGGEGWKMTQLEENLNVVSLERVILSLQEAFVLSDVYIWKTGHTRV